MTEAKPCPGLIGSDCTGWVVENDSELCPNCEKHLAESIDD